MDDELRILYRLISSDSYAAEFQSLGQYRSALLKRIRELLKENEKGKEDGRSS